MKPGHYVIVGSGIAGLTAAETLRQVEPRAHITLVSEEAHDFYSRPGLAYFLRKDVPEKQLFIRTRDDLRALQLDRIAAAVARVVPDQHHLVLTDGSQLTYDRLLLATGALAVPPPFPGGDLGGVVKLDGLDDARAILRLVRRARVAVVVGGGITALELAEGLNARGVRVHYFLRGLRYWSDVLDEAESRLIMDRLQHEGVRIHTETQVKQALGSRGQLTGVETQAGTRVDCQILAVAIGVRPRVDLARAAGLRVGKGILVNQFLQTSSPDIFAAGDAAEVVDPHTGASTLDVLWPTALAQGKAAGINMAGGMCGYSRGIPFNVTMLAGLKATIIGAIGGGKANDDLVAITRGESEAWRMVPGAWHLDGSDGVNRVRLALGQRHIVGALVLGDQTLSRPLQRLITARADLTPIRPALASDGADALAQLVQFYRYWERAQSG